MAGKPRLALVAPGLGRPCGIHDYALLFAQFLSREYSVKQAELPLTPSWRLWRSAAFQANDCDLVHIHFEPGLFQIPRPFFNRFATLMNRIVRPSLVILHGGFPSLRPAWGRKTNYSVRDMVRDFVNIPFLSNWEKRQYQRADHWLVHCPQLAATVSDLAGADNVTHFPLPIPPVANKWSSSAEHPLDLISPGFVKAHKGYQSLLALFDAMHYTRWTLAGGPQDAYDHIFAGKLREMIDGLHLHARVQVTGFLSRNDLEDRVVRAKAAIFPFHRAAGSASLSWAIGLGVPILATDLPSFTLLHKEGAGIRLLPLNHKDAWPEIILSVLGDQEEQSRLSRANLRYACNRGFPQLALQVEKIHQRLLAVKNR